MPKKNIYRWPLLQKGQFGKAIIRCQALDEINGSNAIAPITDDYRSFLHSFVRVLGDDDPYSERSVLNEFENFTLCAGYTGKAVIFDSIAATLISPALIIHLISPIGMEGDIHEIAIIKDNKTKHYIVLKKRDDDIWGRAATAFSVCGYGLPLVNPVQEVRDIVSLWTAFFQSVKQEARKPELNTMFFKLTPYVHPTGINLRNVLKKYVRHNEYSPPIVPAPIHKLLTCAPSTPRHQLQKLHNVLTSVLQKKVALS
ncbi:MAG: hypothetical protein PHW63_01530 [Alphaproteobacteria bacterium]|nr:hypothetical protein [Alphaproteobacteria bacterium]